MRLTALLAILFAAAQALPTARQIYAPVAQAPVTIAVAAGDDLQDALNRAKAGDVITLAPGATFTGNFVLPQRSGSRFITLRTARTEGLPEDGDRISPAHHPKLATIRS